MVALSQQNALRAEQLFKEHEKLEANGDKQGALEKLRGAAALNAPYAVSALAYEYYNNYKGLTKQALSLYRRAVKLGDPMSAINIARHYESVCNSRWYIFWLNKASRMGFEEADEELRNPFPYLTQRAQNLVATGERAKALKLLQFAATHGSQDARRVFSEL